MDADNVAEKEPDIVAEKEPDIVTEKEDDIITENAFVTFIIPSIGRATLSRTLESLISQTNPNWKAIVIFDGISANIDNIDSRITFLECEKLGRETNSAGLVRNYGIQFADTEWIAFVDDDDCISNDYVELFKNEILEYDVDILIFRMKCEGQILPSLDTETFFGCEVGISFGLKRKIFEAGVIFEPNRCEDFLYLDNARNKNYKIMISPHVTYFVKNYENIIENQKGNRVFINFTHNTMEPFFKENDIILFNKYLDNASVYFEFGSGGSTYQAFIKNNVKKIYSVESDFDWHNKLKLIIGNADKINFIFNEMDVRPNNWGHPGPNSTSEQKIDYSSQIEYLNKEEKKAIDLILIDGRFRVACCLKCFNEINDDCFIIFNDFLYREEYHVVLDYYFIVEKTEDETMVVLKKKQDVSYLPHDLIKKYELIEN